MRAVNTTSVNVPLAEPSPAPAPGSVSVRLWLGIVAATLVAWLLLLGWRTAGTLGEVGAAAVRARTESPAQRIQRASGLSAEFLAAIRAASPADGRLVLYSPYGGREFELDGNDPRGEPARQVRGLFERCKNLLYPHPRDVHFARDAEELRGLVTPAGVGRLLVVDGTQGDTELAVGGTYELVHAESLGTARLRLWRLRGVR